MKILVTGGAGFIGSNLTKELLKRQFSVVCVDNLDEECSYPRKIKEKNIALFLKNNHFKFYETDIRDFPGLEKIFGSEKPQKVCHLAAKAGVRQSLKNPQLYVSVNVVGTTNLLELSKKYEIENFVFASSSSVYGKQNHVPFREDAKTDFLLNPYAVTKKTGEMMLWTYHSLYNLNCTALRLFTVFGPSGRPDMAPFLFVDAISKGKPIKKFGDGNSKRDYTYVTDIVEGIIAAIENNLCFEIINLGNNKPVSLNSFIRTIEMVVGKKAVIQNLEKQLGDMEITCADITKAQKLLNYHPKVSLKEGIEQFFLWYRKNY